MDADPPSPARWLLAASRHPVLVDAGVAFGLTALSLLIIAGGAGDFGRIEPLSLLLILLQTVPLLFRRMAPVPVLVITMAALVGQGLFAGETFNSSLGALVALFTVAERCDRRTAVLAALGAALAIAALIIAKAGIQAGLAGLVQSQLSVVVAWLVGTWAQERRRYIGTVEERSARAERERETRAARAVAEERERIARELHDVVSHHVSVIVIQAGAGLRALERRPADARTALEAIDSSGRRAMTDMRRMLGILGRSTDTTAGPEPGPAAATADDARSPMPGLDRLGELIEHVRATGQRVELAVTGEPRPLDPGVELAAYRIVQEALTNTLKHAPNGHVSVAIGYGAEELAVEVVDDGGTRVDGASVADGALAHEGEGGRGLIGMVERAALFGGRLEAGQHGAGFRVVARLPLDPVPVGATS